MDGYAMLPMEVRENFYYLVREMHDLGIRARDKHFDGALEYIRENGIAHIEPLLVDAVLWSAKVRNREHELDAAVEGVKNRCP